MEKIMPFETKERTFSLNEYLELSEKEKTNIRSSKILPPKLGENTFGEIQVNYKYPVLTREN